MSLDHFEARSDDRAAVEGADGKPERQGLNQHSYPHGGTAAVHRKINTALAQQAHCAHARISQTLVRGDQRAVHIRYDERNVVHDDPLPAKAAADLVISLPRSLPLVASPSLSITVSAIACGCVSIDTTIGRSSSRGSCRAANWLSSNDAGMKCPCRRADLRAISSRSPVR